MDELKHLGKMTVAGRMSRRDFLGRASALGISASMAGTLLSNIANAAAPQRGGALKAGLQGGESTNSLDPATFASSVPYQFGRCWGDTLVETTPTGDLAMRLAETVEASDDAQVWRFKIRQGVEFHNGKTMTAEDVLATLERHSGEDTKSGALGIMRGIKGMSVDGGDTVVLELDTPNADLPYLMADYHLIVQPNGGKDAPDAGIGTGPYKVSVNEPGVRQGGERFANYWDDQRGFADQVEIIVINDATARNAALQGGQVHMINRVEPKVVNLLKRVPGVTVQNVAGRGHYVMIMHVDTAPFDNADLRTALKYAIDRQELVDKILRGYGSIGNDMPVNAAYPLFDDAIPQREYDPEAAAFYYRRSGHDGPVVLRTADAAFPGAVDAAALFQQSASKAGITLEVKREPNDGYWSEVWNKQPFCCSYWGGRPTQDQMYSTAYLSSADWNDTRFKSGGFDAMLMQARGELDQTKRKQIYSDMGMMVRNDGGLICPMFNDFIDVVSDKVTGYEKDPNGEMMNGFALAKCGVA